MNVLFWGRYDFPISFSGRPGICKGTFWIAFGSCQQRTLTPPDTWSCPTLGLACVLMSRPISPELVLSPDFWISNIPRYFSFALRKFYGRGSYQTIWGPPLPNVTRHSGGWPYSVSPSIDQALHQVLTLLLIWTLFPDFDLLPNCESLHRTFATGAVCQQRTLTPPDTWSCPL